MAVKNPQFGINLLLQQQSAATSSGSGSGETTEP